MATTRAVLRDTATMVRRLSQRVRTASPQVQPMLQRAQQQLQAIRPLVQRVVDQTRTRLVGGDTHVPDKVLSIFEPHTETIRKGTIAKPNEFGKLVTIQESEHQIITAYDVHAKRPADVTLWTAALDRHQTVFGRAPDLAAGDRGFSSATNEQAATDRGVRRVVLPRRGPKSPARRGYERQRWFRRGQRWRVGCEGRIPHRSSATGGGEPPPPNVQPKATARATVALHSSLVGNRQSPGEDWSVNPQSPSFRPAAA
jgi:IS5 family transposase